MSIFLRISFYFLCWSVIFYGTLSFVAIVFFNLSGIDQVFSFPFSGGILFFSFILSLFNFTVDQRKKYEKIFIRNRIKKLNQNYCDDIKEMIELSFALFPNLSIVQKTPTLGIFLGRYEEKINSLLDDFYDGKKREELANLLWKCYEQTSLKGLFHSLHRYVTHLNYPVRFEFFPSLFVSSISHNKGSYRLFSGVRKFDEAISTAEKNSVSLMGIFYEELEKLKESQIVSEVDSIDGKKVPYVRTTDVKVQKIFDSFYEKAQELLKINNLDLSSLRSKTDEELLKIEGFDESVLWYLRLFEKSFDDSDKTPINMGDPEVPFGSIEEEDFRQS